ncbi:MAG: ABC transporter permease [Egibacteraceae bacterium]
MTTFIVRRLLFSIPVLVAASILIFFFVRVSGDPLAEVRRRPNVSQVTIANIEERKHLNEPLVAQYGYWLSDALTNNFGTTTVGDRPIWPDLRRVMGNTLQLVIAAEILAVTCAVAVGIYSARKQYSLFDYTATTLSFLGFSMPVFWLALILQVIFVKIYQTTGVHVLYTGGLSSPGAASQGFFVFFVDRLQHLGLPIITIAAISMATYSRYTRASMLEVINSDYVRTARAKGLSEKRVIRKHAFRNALIPLTTVVTINFGVAFGGAVVTESVFSLDGMGKYFIDNLTRRDVFPVMAWLMVTAVLVVIFNLLADIIYGYLDPRIRYD